MSSKTMLASRAAPSTAAPRFALASVAALAVAGCARHDATFAAPAETAAAPASKLQPSSIELGEWGPHDEYGEYLAAPAELASVPINDIVKSIRLNAQAMWLGEAVYINSCAECHGLDLKGIPEQHTPDLTDSFWRFSGDDLGSAGATKLPSDVAWTVRYGVRSGMPNARGVEVGMLAYDPQFRSKKDTEDFGSAAFLTRTEIEDMAEYVLQLGGQPHDAAMAKRAAPLFQDNARGNCYDCHGKKGQGIDAFGSTDLTRPSLYIYGSDRAGILESITIGRHTMMPAFDGVLRPEELNAVSVFVFSQAAK